MVRAIEYSKVVDGRVIVIASSPVSAGFRPAEKLIGGYSFSISSAAKSDDFTKSHVVGSWQPGKITVAGKIDSNDVPGFERAWKVRTIDTELSYEQNGFCMLMAKVKGFASPPSETRNLFAFDAGIRVSGAIK